MRENERKENIEKRVQRGKEKGQKKRRIEKDISGKEWR